MDKPVNPVGDSGSTHPSSQSSNNPFPPIKGSTGMDPWLAYAQQMFPNNPDAVLYIKQLKDNMIKMIGVTINEINARHAKANEFNRQVARDQE
jgi:hypothetical protein